ncbi:AraC family transcriptional regulator [Enterococcus sp. AZ103]|uniref:AraC family transcriptional regulator n=1 Tax=Enterococcus sp. AZ103 TaxID=2774628 RepID=UPI003F1E8017
MDKKKLVDTSIDYILEHYKENILIEDIADYLYLSKFYFSRIFKEVTGESVYSFIKRLKVEQSAIDIKLEKTRTFSDIGLDYGYSANNYSTVFKNLFQVSPTEFRKTANSSRIINPFDNEKIEELKSFENYQAAVQIKNLPDYPVIYQRTLDNYLNVKQNWSNFIDHNKANMTSATIMIEKFYTDPSSTTQQNNLCDLCLSVTEKTEAMATVSGGKYAVYSFEGYIPDIFNELQGLFSIWLPQSKFNMREQYGLSIYREVDWQNGYVKLDCCIPVK